MEDQNNFKKVYEKEAPEKLREHSLKNAQGSVKTVRSFFDVLDLYISKFFGAIIHTFKDNSNSGISANNGLAFGISQEAPDEEDKAEPDGKFLDESDTEDWYSDSDAPKE